MNHSVEILAIMLVSAKDSQVLACLARGSDCSSSAKGVPSLPGFRWVSPDGYDLVCTQEQFLFLDRLCNTGGAQDVRWIDGRRLDVRVNVIFG